jgi:hypothetical protein
MKKLILIPTVILTVFLVLAFLAPATASGILNTVAPALQTRHASVQAVHFGEPAVASSPEAGLASGTQTAASGSPASSTQSTSTAQLAPQPAGIDRSHAVATAGQTNCGRFGNGHHGGKHDFTCPNQPFPAPAS